MDQLIVAYQTGFRRILDHERPSWLNRNQGWVAPLLAALAGATMGSAAPHLIALI